MFQGIVKPLLSQSQASPLSARQFIDPLRRVNPQLASAIERLQQAQDSIVQTLRSEPSQADEIVFTDPEGNVIFWVGSREGYFGGWFGQLYVGGTGPVNANLYVDNTGLLTIRDALITLTSGDKEIRLDPAGPTFKMTDTDAEVVLQGFGDLVTLSGVHSTNLSGFSISTDGQLSITGTSLGSTPTLAVGYYGNAGSPLQQFLVARGDPTAATAVSAGQSLGETQYFGHDGTVFIMAGNTLVKAKAVSSGAVTSTIQHDYDEHFFQSNGIDAIRILAADKLVFGTGSNTAGWDVDFEKKVIFQDNIRANGSVLLNSLTASRILKLNGSKIVTADKVNLDSANDVAITGASAGDVLQWDGSKVSVYTLSGLATALKTYLDSYYSTASHTHNAAISQSTDDGGSPLHSHGISTFSTGTPV